MPASMVHEIVDPVESARATVRTMAHTVAITTSAAQTMRAAVAFAKNTMCRRGSSAKVVRTSAIASRRRR